MPHLSDLQLKRPKLSFKEIRKHCKASQELIEANKLKRSK
jgi:hypothetical protein